MEPKKGTLNREEAKRWISNTLVFLAPVLLIYFGSVAPLLQDGLNVSDFAITPMVGGAMALYIINVAMDFLKKLSQGK